MERDDAILDYLQGKMPKAERNRFEAAMADDASLAGEVDVMRAVRAELANAPKHEKADAVWDRLSAAIDPVPQVANENRAPWTQMLRYAAVAAVAVACWQVAIVPRMGGGPEGYRAASESTDAFILQVKFVDGATVAEITDLLAEVEGTISDGPSALGIMRLSFAAEDLRRQALEVLSSREGLVELVQAQ